MGGRGRLYLTLHCHHQNDSCSQKGSDESRLNVSLIVRGKVTRQYPQVTIFEEKAREPKRKRTDTLLLISLIRLRYTEVLFFEKIVSLYKIYPLLLLLLVVVVVVAAAAAAVVGVAVVAVAVVVHVGLQIMCVQFVSEDRLC